MTVIVYGPPACGKTRSSAKLAARFGLKVIVDCWDHRQHRLTPGAIHLTCIEPKGQRFVRFETLDLTRTPEAPFLRERATGKNERDRIPADQLYRRRPLANGGEA